MIIKIKTYLDVENKDKFQWWIEDNITKTRVVYLTNEEWNQANTIGRGGAVADCYAEDPAYPSNPAIKLICNRADGEIRRFIFQTEAYLLNDDGKTIERLTP